MIDNFKLSSSVLLERLKDLEAQTSMIGERPQTANVLSKISKCLPAFNECCSRGSSRETNRWGWSKSTARSVQGQEAEEEGVVSGSGG
jgi:hypothetical protein